MKALKIGIATQPELKARTLAIASGAYKPGGTDPKLWFTSLEGLAKVLSEPNRRLLDLIIRKEPRSMSELAELSGRAMSNLSRTIATMERYGLVHTHKDRTGKTVIRVPYQSIAVEVPIAATFAARAPERTSRPGRRPSFDDAVEIWRAWHQNQFVHRIAANFDISPGRVYEIVHGKVYTGSKEVAERALGRQITRVPRRHARAPTSAPLSGHIDDRHHS